jgi:cytochrome c oxidase subunit 2
MKSHRVVLLALVVALVPLVAAVRVAPVAASPATAAVQVIEVKAEKYHFTPDKIDIPLGTAVQFKITALDNEHGFEIEGVKDSCVKIPKGETKTVDYKAEKAGKVSFKCCHRCGIGHIRMNGAMTVK